MSDAYFVFLVLLLLVGIVAFLAPAKARSTVDCDDPEKEEDVDG